MPSLAPPPIEPNLLHIHYGHASSAGVGAGADAVVLHRIVSSASSLRGDVDNDDDVSCSSMPGMMLGDSGIAGDIIASIVLINRDHDNANDGNGKRAAKTVTMATVQRMDGVTVASFELPPLYDNHSSPSKPERPMPGAANTPLASSRYWESGYRDQIMCWASFRRAKNTSTKNRYDVTTSISDNTSSGRKMLCVLGNPTTLLVFDALGDTALVSTTSYYTTPNTTAKKYHDIDYGEGGGEGGGMEGPGGHTIPLPFSARSIFPNEGGGLLISRVPSEEDHMAAVHEYFAAPGSGEGYPGNDNHCLGVVGMMEREGKLRKKVVPTSPTGLSLPATPRVLQQRRRDHSRYMHDDDDGNMNYYDYEKDVDNDDDENVSLEGPPMPLRFHEGGGYASTIGSLFADDNDDPTPAMGVNAMISGDGDGVPCLFSLRHPLDEIHPMAVVVTTPNAAISKDVEGERDDDSGGLGGDSNSKNINNRNVKLFSNVLETLVYVGSPRLFHGDATTTSITKASPICVTYNERMARHTIWSLSRTISPAEALPLWKTTGRGTWRSSSSSFCSENIKPSHRFVGVEDDEGDYMDHHRQQQLNPLGGEVPSRFSYIHPHFTLSKLFVEDDAIFLRPSRPPHPPSPPLYCPHPHPHPPISSVANADPAAAAAAAGTNYDDDSDGGSTMKRYQRHVFLATDMLGKGDLVLCVFMPSHYLKAKDENVKQNAADGARDDSSVKTKETPAILRCFSLACCHNQSEVVSIQSVSHLVDLPCLSAQPVQSIPIPQASFSWRDDGEGWYGSCSRKRTTRFHNLDRDTLAADILIICPQCVVTDDLQNDGYDGNMDGKNGLTIGLYRAGVVHITDFAIPQSSLDATCKPTFVRLENAVENRVDIRFLLTADDSNAVNGEEGGKGRKQECRHGPTVAILRVSFSLLMHTSSIAETALRAIESSLVHGSCQANKLTATDYSKVLPSQYQPIRHDSFGLEGFPVSLLVTILPILIRADAARLFQQTTSSHDRSKAKMKNSSLKVEDDGWYSLTVVLLSLLGMKGEDGEERTPAATTMQQTEQKETMKHLWSVATWDNLLQTDFHSTFCDGEGQILFGDDLGYLQDAVEQSATTYESDVFGDGCKYDAKLLSSLACAGKLEANAAERGEVGNNDMLVRSYKQLIFDSLHLLHEDSRLVSQSRGSSWTRRLGTLLLHVSGQMSPLMMDYEDHFTRLLGNSRCLSNACNSFSGKLEDKERLSSFVTPPCIMTCLDGILQVDAGDFEAEDTYGIAEFKFLLESELNGICSYTWMVLRLYTILFDRHSHLSKTMFEGDSGLSQKHRDRATILAMLDEGVYHSYQLHDELPLGVALPLLEVTRRCCLDPPQVNSKGDCWPPAAFDLVGRNDLAEFVSRSMQGSSYFKEADFNDVSPSSDDINSDGLVGLEDFSSMIFPDDNRVREAVRLLRSSRPLFLRVARPVELSDHEYERSKQEKLLLLCRRSIALPLGRGMLTLGTHHVPSAEQLVIPSIVMAGRVPPVNGTLALDMTACPSNFRVWPEFHNGVAAGLRLPHASDDTNAKTITRTWIKFNKPMYVADIAGSNNSAQMSPPSYAHGGVLMALGLRGYLSALTTIDLTDYLTQGTITTTVGIFLGMASNKRGSCDPSVSKMLCLHVPSLLPPSFLPMDLASPVQAAAVAGIGLLYQGSSHRLMTEFLLSEMGRQPAKDQNSNDRESFALVCGLALGMVNLKRGTSTVSGLEDLRIEERLHCYITGAANGGDFSGRNEGYEGRVGRCNQGDMDWNSRIDEVNSLNTDITASGATLALGLMYMRSQNASVAASLQLPDTHFLLDYKRPDMLALRVISRSLILWNDIKPTPEWIDLQIPSIVKNSINLMKNAAKRAMNIGTNSDVDVMDEQGDAGGDDNTKKEVTDFDPQAIRQANTYIISGACLALGLKYAGSASRAAASAIIERALWLLELRDNKDAVTLTQRPDNSTLVTCLCTAAISLAMVMSGTGDLDSFRLFRALRWKCDDGTLYGTHMAFGAAIGLLFLGGGKCTLGSRPEDVAVLITAFYPHFPILSSDNQYHLQALRHLYVLAVHERILEACDVDSNEKAYLPIELSLADSNELVQASLPFLVANDSNFAGLRSKSDRYYPIVINTTDWNTCGNLTKLFVKRKAGHLSYLQDPSGLRSLSLQQVGIANKKSLLNSVNLFSNDATLTSFAKFFCSSSFNDEKSFESCCSDIAYECVKEEKSSDILAVHVKIFKLIDAIGGMKVGIEDVLGVKLLLTYVKMRERLTDGPIATASHLINGETLSLLCESFHDTFQINDSMLMTLAKKCTKELFDRGNRHMVSAFLVWTGVPLHHGPEERRLP